MNRTNILLAGDDEDDYNLFVEAFKKVPLAYNITWVKNGLECMVYLKTHEKPAIVFLNLNMPIKNGLDCLKYIKDNDALLEIPVIIFSKSLYIKHIDTAFKNGAYYYIEKPNSINDLVEILTKIINRINENTFQPAKETFVLRKMPELQI